METKIDGKDVLVLSDSDMKKLQEIEEQITYHEEQAKKLDADGEVIEKFKAARAKCEKSIIIRGKDALSDVFYNFDYMKIIGHRARPLVDDAKMSDIKALEESIIIETINMAIKAGIDVNAQIRRNNLGYYASTPKACKLLIDAGANSKTLGAALIYANNAETTKLLLDAGADVNVRSKYSGQTALMIARTEEQTKLLIDAGADVNARDDDGNNALFGKTNLKAVQRLVHAGIDINNVNKQDCTALKNFAYKDYKKHVKFLLDHGANIDLTHWENPLPQGMQELLDKAKNEPISKKLERAKIQIKNAETKKRIKGKLKTATKRLSGVVIADKMAEMIRAGEIQTPITPEKGKKLRKQIIEDHIKGRK